MTEPIEFEVSTIKGRLMTCVDARLHDTTPAELDIVARRRGYIKHSDFGGAIETVALESNHKESIGDAIRRIIRERDDYRDKFKVAGAIANAKRQLAEANASAVPEKWRRAIEEATKHDTGSRLDAVVAQVAYAMSECSGVWRLAEAASHLLSCLERSIENESGREDGG